MKIQLENSVSKLNVETDTIEEVNEVNVNIIIHDLYSKSVYCNTDFGRVEITSTENYDENNPYNFTSEDIINKVKTFVSDKHNIEPVKSRK